MKVITKEILIMILGGLIVTGVVFLFIAIDNCNAQGRMKTLGDEVYEQTDKELQKELKEILLENRREFFRQKAKESAERTKSAPLEFINFILMPQTDYIKAQKELQEMRELQKQRLNKIKRQKRINTTKNILKWGLLIYIVVKI